MSKFQIGDRVYGPFGRGDQRHTVSGVITSMGVDNTRAGSDGVAPIESGSITLDVPERTPDAVTRFGEFIAAGTTYRAAFVDDFSEFSHGVRPLHPGEPRRIGGNGRWIVGHCPHAGGHRTAAGALVCADTLMALVGSGALRVDSLRTTHGLTGAVSYRDTLLIVDPKAIKAAWKAVAASLALDYARV